MVKTLPANAVDARDRGLIPGSGRSFGVGNGSPLQYSCLENSMDRGAHGITESQTWLSSWAHIHILGVTYVNRCKILLLYWCFYHYTVSFIFLWPVSLVAQMVKHLPAMQETWVGKIPWRRKWQSTPAVLPGKSHGWRSLIGYSPWGRKESDTTEWLHFIFLYGLCKTKYFIWCEYCDPSFLVIFVCMK